MITSKELTLTPALAKEILEKSQYNTSPDQKGLVKTYAAAMARGEWMNNGQGLIFDSEGHLLDGKHRCMAVIQSNVTIKILATFGIDKDSFVTMDRGRVRNGWHALHIAGKKNATSLSAAAVWVYREENKAQQLTIAPSVPQIMDIIESHPDLEKSASCCSGMRKLLKLINPGIVVYAHWRMGLIDPIQRDVFLAAVDSGVSLLSTDPAFILREELKQKDKKYPAYMKLAFLIKAFSAFYLKQNLKKLRFNEDFNKFPEWPSAKAEMSIGFGR